MHHEPCTACLQTTSSRCQSQVIPSAWFALQRYAKLHTSPSIRVVHLSTEEIAGAIRQETMIRRTKKRSLGSQQRATSPTVGSNFRQLTTTLDRFDQLWWVLTKESIMAQYFRDVESKGHAYRRQSNPPSPPHRASLSGLSSYNIRNHSITIYLTQRSQYT